MSPVDKMQLPKPDQLLPGRSEEMLVPDRHYVLGAPLSPPFPDGLEYAMFGMGCFWGAERKFWESTGVFTTFVGYAAGGTPNPTYQEVCTGRTGHNEVVRVLFDPSLTSYSQMIQIFWESHDPTQYMQQGNDLGTQYRSGLYYSSRSNKDQALASLDSYQTRLNRSGFGKITTEILPAPHFYYAEAYHQQYLAKNPSGYCGLGGTGVSCTRT